MISDHRNNCGSPLVMEEPQGLQLQGALRLPLGRRLCLLTPLESSPQTTVIGVHFMLAMVYSFAASGILVLPLI